MAYLGLSPDYPDQYFSVEPQSKTGAEQYDLIEQRVQPTLTPIQQTPAQGGGLALAAIAAFLILSA